jgi:prepilin-type N-terminal cleavage/methylation domain-containing protein
VIRLLERVRARLGGEAGFTLIEVLAAMVIIVVGIISTISVFDGSHKLTTVAEKNQVESQVAEQEVENILASNTYSSLAMDQAPTHSTNTRNPNFWVTTAATYNWNQDATTPPESFCVYPSCTGSTPATGTTNGAVAAGPSSWTSGRVSASNSSSSTRLSGQIYRYVTLLKDSTTICSNCTGASDYKRITVAVTVNGPNGPQNPVVVSTLVSDPTAGPGPPKT